MTEETPRHTVLEVNFIKSFFRMNNKADIMKTFELL